MDFCSRYSFSKGFLKSTNCKYTFKRKENGAIKEVQIAFSFDSDSTAVNATSQGYKLNMKYACVLDKNQLSDICTTIANYMFMVEYKIGVDAICEGTRIAKLSNKLFANLKLELTDPQGSIISKLSIVDRFVTDYTFVIYINDSNKCRINFDLPIPYCELQTRIRKFSASVRESLTETLIID